jgi:uncharacterized repeat protein (TIGR03803 family)
MVAMASWGKKSGAASAISVVLALLLVSLAICAPAARAQSWGEVVLHSFGGDDSATPDAGLIQGSDGNFYGTTAGTGMGFGSSNGTVFKITPAGALTALYSFCSQADCTDGAHPQAGLIQGSDGNFYGTTQYGGANVGGVANPLWTNPGGINPGGTVFKITPSGKLTTLYSFCSKADCTDGQWPIAGVIQGSDGNFYGTTGYGGAHGYKYGTVFKLTPSGKLTTLYSFCSQADCTDGASPNGVIEGGDGNLYGTTMNGGANSNGGTVFKLTPSGTLTTLYSFCSKTDCTDGASPNGLIKGGDGNFYGTTSEGGANVGGGTVFRLTPSGTLTTLYSFSGEADDTAAPNGVIFGRDGNLYGTTAGGPANKTSTVFKLTPSGQLTTLYSFCSERATCTCPDGDAPNDLIEGIDGNFYGTTSNGGANGYGTVFKVGASLPTPTDTPTATSTPGHIAVIPNETACDVSKAKADDLLGLAPLGSSFQVSPGVKCTVEGLSPASYYCDTKTETVLDQMLGQGRRLIVMRTTNTRKPRVDDQLFVFGCAFGRVARMLTARAGASGGQLKIEHADPNEITFTGPPTPPGNVFGARERQTLDIAQNPQPLADTLPCGEMKAANANDLIILANHEFDGGFGGFPFTHGVGCYENGDWKVTLEKDRMISANRREIFLISDHQTGTGEIGYSYVFGCVAGQVRLVFGDASSRAKVRSACDEQAPPKSRDRQPPESPAPGYNCAGWEDSKSDQLTFIDAAWGPGDTFCEACGSSGQEVMTFKWSPELQNYVLTSVHYRPTIF